MHDVDITAKVIRCIAVTDRLAELRRDNKGLPSAGSQQEAAMLNMGHVTSLWFWHLFSTRSKCMHRFMVQGGASRHAWSIAYADILFPVYGARAPVPH